MRTSSIKETWLERIERSEIGHEIRTIPISVLEHNKLISLLSKVTTLLILNDNRSRYE